MKVFHAPDYIEFLQRVSPANQRDMNADLVKCRCKQHARGAANSSHNLSAADNFGETSDTDCPVFDGIFDFCQIYAGASLGQRVIFIDNFPASDLTICGSRQSSTCRRCQQTQLWLVRYCYQLGWRTPPRQESWWIGFLLRERHSARYP